MLSIPYECTQNVTRLIGSLTCVSHTYNERYYIKSHEQTQKSKLAVVTIPIVLLDRTTDADYSPQQVVLSEAGARTEEDLMLPSLYDTTLNVCSSTLATQKSCCKRQPLHSCQINNVSLFK